jgi:hypothetical protein
MHFTLYSKLREIFFFYEFQPDDGWQFALWESRGLASSSSPAAGWRAGQEGVGTFWALQSMQLRFLCIPCSFVSCAYRSTRFGGVSKHTVHLHYRFRGPWYACCHECTLTDWLACVSGSSRLSIQIWCFIVIHAHLHPHLQARAWARKQNRPFICISLPLLLGQFWIRCSQCTVWHVSCLAFGWNQMRAFKVGV